MVLIRPQARSYMKHQPTKSRRVWHTLEATGILALGSLAGCGTDDRAAGNDVAAESTPAESSVSVPPAGGEGAGEGPGEGAGEGEGVMDSALTSADDVAYLTQLGLMRGHLWVGNELYQSNLPGMATTHMKHPKAELYSTLEEPFAVRGVAGFSNELEVLANLVAGNNPASAVNSAYAELTAAISATELGANTTSAKIIGEVIVGLLRTAAEEYAIGVVDNKINNLHEYQDALGFTQIAGQWAKSAALLESSAAAAASIQGIINELTVMWPGLNPQKEIPHSAARLYGAAAMVEIQVLGL